EEEAAGAGGWVGAGRGRGSVIRAGVAGVAWGRGCDWRTGVWFPGSCAVVAAADRGAARAPGGVGATGGQGRGLCFGWRRSGRRRPEIRVARGFARGRDARPPGLNRRCRGVILRVHDGTWRSPVAHLNGVQGVAGSNPAVPTAEI